MDCLPSSRGKERCSLLRGPRAKEFVNVVELGIEPRAPRCGLGVLTVKLFNSSLFMALCCIIKSICSKLGNEQCIVRCGPAQRTSGWRKRGLDVTQDMGIMRYRPFSLSSNACAGALPSLVTSSKFASISSHTCRPSLSSFSKAVGTLSLTKKKDAVSTGRTRLPSSAHWRSTHHTRRQSLITLPHPTASGGAERAKRMLWMLCFAEGATSARSGKVAFHLH